MGNLDLELRASATFFWNGRKGKLLDESEPDITGASRSSPKGLGAKGKVTGQK